MKISMACDHGGFDLKEDLFIRDYEEKSVNKIFYDNDR